ncbi:unnamed protein product [Rotaria sp. Silwood2]|nr:unnamed protein product [Rotaria sp. Silwood2]CAF2822017.1 unnamed protein product [Rotaria sp. Silwood2]CAF3246625.1 unnamed protein product [Rotaria sp. Silwood2]CAF4159661.1 unnamed protein product [Rotaria sp. Silwood2]CAF4343720.1 unnamed protein product [Rotaria sp. Silwood2]
MYYYSLCVECPEVDVNKATLSGITSLLMVVEIGWSDILDILLQDGAIVDLTYSDKRAEDKKIVGSIPLIGATKYNSAKCIKLLLARNTNSNHKNQSGVSVILLADEKGYFKCLK